MLQYLRLQFDIIQTAKKRESPPLPDSLDIQKGNINIFGTDTWMIILVPVDR